MRNIKDILNLWNRRNFKLISAGKKIKLFSRIKHTFRCIKWSEQRATRGFADCDVWNMDSYLQALIPEMLQNLKDTRIGSPSFGENNSTNPHSLTDNDSFYEEWNKILEKMIFLWREMDEETCSLKNPYEKEFSKPFDEFEKKYGFLGEKLQTIEEIEANKLSGSITMHSMDELPEYKEIYEKYYEEERRLNEYRWKCKDEAFDMLKKYFYDLWD